MVTYKQPIYCNSIKSKKQKKTHKQDLHNKINMYYHEKEHSGVPNSQTVMTRSSGKNMQYLPI